ncbi:LOW QUALITY PROTEIN: protein transport protein Sec31A-like [Pomacea canaliculata]|uniref:LOW QUALITY PROTEIN: protein transport protein Sec31A-like n=1 Tax=Pomacea canaliculata TaxID=400727 RepID=UPI000D728A77|nr:LOW QUALITY PROTEIN: protein transport protein Sec31A-like [Pomacea canaliculata]
MRVKEIERTANVGWSPASQYPIYMVAGTAAQQLDATFSTSSCLEIYSLNLAEATLEMPLVASIPSECRFHKVLWGSFGSDIERSGLQSGVVVAGADDGTVLMYDAQKMIAENSECLLAQLKKHVGAVKALDFNPFQTNLLASGGAESEIFIWDLNKPDSPMTPGQKSQPPEEVACVAWNRQVQHILASNFTGRCVVWDLRKNEPIIKVSDSMSRIKAKMVAWHPEVATQMCLSSEDDHTPVIQLWDLRYATSPLKVLENHKRGILSVAWCQRDPDLLLSCGKDNRILCWNPNSSVQTGEVVYELPTNNQWSFDVQWCPRNPGLISSSTFDGHVTIYSLMGGGHPIQPSNKVAESFNTGDPYSQVPVQVPHVEEKVMSLQKPPKWVRKPVGASFAFGGKLVTFECPAAGKPLQTSPQRIVHISQVVTETELVTRSNQLQQALSAGQYLEFCALKASNSASAMEENIWNFLRVNFENEPRTKFLQLLGYDQTELAKKVANYTGADGIQPLSPGVDAKELAQKMSLLGTGDASCATGLSASGQASPSVGSKTPNSRDELSEGSAAFDEIASSHGRESGLETPLVIPTENAGEASSLMVQALLMGNFEAAVEMCLQENKMAEAILLAIAGGPELLLRTQKKYFKRNKSNLGRLISSIVTHDWSHIVNTCDLDNWKEALALILTYALPEEFPQLCDGLAARLETERNGDLALYASLCYICSGNLEKLVENWVQNTENSNSPLALQDLVEKVMILKKAVEASRGQTAECGDALSERLSMYAGMLASQGNLATAAVYLGNSSNDMRLAALQDRLFRALGPAASVGVTAPRFPFQLVNILPQGTRAQPQTQQQQVSRAGFQRSGSSSGASQQVQSGSFQTTTTTSSSYYDQQQQQQQHQYSVLNGPTATHTTFSQQPAVSTGSVSSKGPLAHKYPSASYQRQAAAYGMDSFPQAGLVQPDYSQTQGYSQQNFYSANYSVSPAQTSGIYNPAASEQMYNPASTPGGPYAGPSLPSQAQFGSSSSSYQDKRPESAWNDPPVVGESKKSKPLSYEQPAPITSPLFGASQPVASEQPPPGAPINYPNYGNLYNPQEHQPLPQQISAPFNPLPANTYMPPPVQIQPPKPAPEPPAPVEKGPVPAEHKVLQEVLDSLLSSCSQRATNAQMKRKLEDVARKLEILYDKLREGALSQSVLLGLHQLVQSVQGCDYGSSLGVHTSLVSHGNFSEISTFMPALKVLLQTASQLNVYVQ